MAHSVPNDHERRALFSWLKQASSLTAWRRLYAYHQAFVDAVRAAFEDEQSSPGVVATIPTEWVADILRSQHAFDVALDRLADGDRRCFWFLGAPGHFSEGLRNVNWWEDMYRGSTYGRNGWISDSRHWPTIERVMHECLAAMSDTVVVLQERWTDKPARIGAIHDYASVPWSSLFKRWLNQPMPPPVRSAVPEVLVPTGKIIPCSGVWEPVRIDLTSGTRTTSQGDAYVRKVEKSTDGCSTAR